MPYYRNEPDYGFVAVILGVVLLFGVIFGGLFYATKLDNERGRQCIEAGKDWIDNNCITR